MNAVNVVACPAVDAMSHQPVSSTLMQKLGRVDHGALLVNAQQQVTVLARMGEVTTALGRSVSKLESLWKLSTASAGAATSIGQIRGCFGDLVGQGKGLAGQVQAAGSLLQNALRILEFVKAANKAVAALMCTPWSMPAAKALATATAATTIGWLGMVAQMAMSIGQAISAVQQATQATDGTTAALGNVLGGGAGTTVPPFTPPTFPTQPAGSTYPAYHSYPTVSSYPAASQPQYPVQPAAQYPTAQTGLPTVYDGWIPRGGTQATTGTTGTGGNAGSGLTIDITDSNRDGKYEVKVNVPESQLDEEISVDVKVGDQDFNIDVGGKKR